LTSKLKFPSCSKLSCHGKYHGRIISSGNWRWIGRFGVWNSGGYRLWRVGWNRRSRGPLFQCNNVWCRSWQLGQLWVLVQSRNWTVTVTVSFGYWSFGFSILMPENFKNVKQPWIVCWSSIRAAPDSCAINYTLKKFTYNR